MTSKIYEQGERRGWLPKRKKKWSEERTLNVIMLNNETFPPDADITYESFLDSAMHEIDSSAVLSVVSFDIRIPLAGCHS